MVPWILPKLDVAHRSPFPQRWERKQEQHPTEMLLVAFVWQTAWSSLDFFRPFGFFGAKIESMFILVS